jgi:hypothetical protein
MYEEGAEFRSSMSTTKVTNAAAHRRVEPAARGQRPSRAWSVACVLALVGIAVAFFARRVVAPALREHRR